MRILSNTSIHASFIWLVLTNTGNCDDWLCKTDSSKAIDGGFRVCGVAEAMDEGEAREAARIRAFREFASICDSSDECRGHKKTARPLRTECAKTANVFKCYRAVDFLVSSEHEDSVTAREQELALLSQERLLKERELKALQAIEAEKQRLISVQQRLDTGDLSSDGASQKDIFRDTFVSWNDGEASRLALGIIGALTTDPFKDSGQVGVSLGLRIRATERVDLHLTYGTNCSVTSSLGGCTSKNSVLTVGLPIFFGSWWGVEPEFAALTRYRSVRSGPGINLSATSRRGIEGSGNFVRVGARAFPGPQYILDFGYYLAP